MGDEYNIVDEKTPAEKKAERLERSLTRLVESERLDKLVRHEVSTIDIIVGILMQVRGWISIRHDTADDVDDYLEDIFDIVKHMVEMMNDRSKGDNNEGAD